MPLLRPLAVNGYRFPWARGEELLGGDYGRRSESRLRRADDAGSPSPAESPGRGGIRAIVTNADLEGGAGVDVLGWATLARVAVNEENAITAREIALEFDRSISSYAEAGGEVVASGEPAGTAARPPETRVHVETLPESWPRCPQCGAPRITKCPACGTSGSGFPPADPTGDESSDEPAAPRLLLCIECDEPFTPEYAHDCEWCSHEFADGFRPRPRTSASTSRPRSWRSSASRSAPAGRPAGLFRDPAGAGRDAMNGVQGSGFRVRGSGFRVQGSGFRVQE